ncbi:MAG: VapE family protein [Bacteroidales bacterium]|nr:VapE family protein [Bacteroidales bacterium]
MTKISYFTRVFEKKPNDNIDFEDYLSGIKTGRWQDVVFNYRSGKIKKQLIPCVTPSGIFSSRNYEGLEEHSGFINIDIDSKDNPDVDLIAKRDEIYADEHVYAGHCSVSGKGITIYVKINPSKHYESFCALEKYFANEYQIIIDQAAKDVPRLRFVSYDPDLYINKKAKKWNRYIEKQKQQPKHFGDYIASKSDFEFVMEQIISRRINIADDYSDWVKVGFAISSEFGEAGLSYFHDISKISDKYNADKCDKKYKSLLGTRTSGITIRTFFWLAKINDCEIKSERTKRIESVGRLRAKQVGTSGGSKNKEEAMREAKTYLKQVEDIDGSDVDEILEQVKDLQDNELKEKTDLQQKIDICIQIIKNKKVRYNIITGKLESEGAQLTDNDINSLYIDSIEVDPTINKDLFITLINSNRVEKVDPLIEFIEKHKHLKPTGNIQKLLDSLNDEMDIQGTPITDYKEIYVYKWLISIIASVYGTYSLMILVLTGKQMTEKTNWFRGLLPNELHSYYAESKLDAGKDDEILMTQKLIIIDDEFGGKSKQEAKKLKDLSSKQYFSIRRPYGKFAEDIRRIAVLGGTSNDDEILNDPTGNRRIIPLRVKSIDIDSYNKINKKELFIEMYHEWRRIGDGWMLTPDEVSWLNKSTIKHEQEVSEEQLIQKYYGIDNNYLFGITSTDVKVNLEQKTQQRLSLYKIGQSLNKLGYKRKAIKTKGSVSQVWNIKEDFE